MSDAPTPGSRSLRAHVLLITVVAIWGGTFVVVKDALADVSPLLFNLIRMTLAFLCLAFFYRGHLDA
jgi:drug/metabolite transporter (DMT)-like permease